MRAFSAFLLSGFILVASSIAGLVTGYLPFPQPTTWFLLFIAYLTVGTKFYVTEVLSSEGLQYPKAWTDLCLAALSAIVSLSVTQALRGKVVFDTPARILIMDDPSSTPTLTQANIGSAVMCAIATLMFLACFASAKYWRGLKGEGRSTTAKKLMSNVVCLAAGSFSCSCYFSTVFLKG